MKEAKVCIGLSNPKTPANVGAVMRAAGCFQVDAVFYTGERYVRAARFNTDTKDASLKIPLTGVSSLLDAVAENMKIVCVEFAEGAVALPEYQHPVNAFYIFGPEDGSLRQALIDKAADVIYVPTAGSLNLAAAVNVVLYDRMAKSACVPANDELICRSRDKNNNLKVMSACAYDSSGRTE